MLVPFDRFLNVVIVPGSIVSGMTLSTSDPGPFGDSSVNATARDTSLPVTALTW